MPDETPLTRYCQNCAYCSPKEPQGLYCNNPEQGFDKEPEPIFWAILKFCMNDRKGWKETP